MCKPLTKFFDFLKLRKRMILPLLLFGILFLFIPTHFSYAGFWSAILGKGLEAVATLPAIMMAFSLSVLMWLARFLLWLSSGILGWAIDNPFPISLTVPGAYPNNPVIQIGWTLTRNLVNMFFILGLAYIGLATALDIGNKFKTRKTFANLLLIALLINFTPVICGVIVDAANIVSNFFLQGVDFSSIVNVFENNQDAVLKTISKPLQIEDNFPVVMQSLLLIVFGLMASFLFLLYSVLFIVRAPIIWILVILSPLAFFAWIFGFTRKHFSQWWNLFIQWAIIAVPAGFFLYLSMHTLTALNNNPLKPLPGTGVVEKLFTSLAPVFVALLFLGIGFVVTMRINAAGSAAIMRGAKFTTKKAKIGGIKAAKWTGKKTAELGEGTKAGVYGAAAGMRQGFKSRTKADPGASRAEKVATLMRNVRGTTGAMAQGALTREGREEGRRVVAKGREKWHLGRQGAYEAGRVKRWAIDEKSQKRLASMSTFEQQEALKRRVITAQDKKERAALVEILSKKGSFEIRDKKGNIDHKKEKGAIEEAQKLGMDVQKIADSRPDLTPIVKAALVEHEMTQTLKKKVDALKASFMTPAGGGLNQKEAEKKAKKQVMRDVRIKEDRIIKQRIAHYEAINPKITPEEAEYKAKQDARRLKREKIEKRMIKEQVQNMSNRNFARNVKSKGALQNADVILALNDQKINALKRASTEQRRIFGKGLQPGTQTIQDLTKEMLKLHRTGRHAEANAILHNIQRWQADPNFKP